MTNSATSTTTARTGVPAGFKDGEVDQFLNIFNKAEKAEAKAGDSDMTPKGAPAENNDLPSKSSEDILKVNENGMRTKI